MARPREFDTNKVLEITMDLFWDHGYRDTSMSDIVEGAAINRASLYNGFGGKHQMFVAALERYQRREQIKLTGILKQSGSARAAIRKTVMVIAKDAMDNAAGRGCLLTNSAIELAQHDTAVRRLVVESFRRLEDAFAEAVARGQRDGEISTRFKPRKVARFMVGSVQGLTVIGKTKPGRQEVLDIVELALSVLD